MDPIDPVAAWVLVRPESLPPEWRERAIPMVVVPLRLRGGRLDTTLLDPVAEAAPRPAPAVTPDELSQISLSAEQRQLIRHVAAGQPHARIASRLGVSARTVERRLATLRRQFGARTTTQLVFLLGGPDAVSAPTAFGQSGVGGPDRMPEKRSPSRDDAAHQESE